MKETIRFVVGLAGMALLAGCAGPKFECNVPPESLDTTGPSIVVLPLADTRSNREADKVFPKDYLITVQGVIGQELESMRFFSSVTVVMTNETPPRADLLLTPTLEQLDSEVPHHGRIKTAKAVAHVFNFISNAALGLPAGNLYLHSGTPVYGNSTLEIAVRRTLDQKVLLNTEYSDTATNRVKKSDCDKSQTKATVMLAAFQITTAEFRDDLFKQLLEDKYAPKTASPKKIPVISSAVVPAGK